MSQDSSPDEFRNPLERRTPLGGPVGVALHEGLAFRLPRVPFRVVSERLL